MTTLRRLWLRVHLWLGLVLGLWFVLLGLTGSLLVFYPEIDRLLVPAQRVSAACVAPASLDEALARLRELEPSRTGPWRFELPREAGIPLIARYYQPTEKKGRHFAPLLVTLDPCTLERTSSRLWGETTMTVVYDLHYQLLLDAAGGKAVGIGGFLLLLSMASGLVLWWPRNGSWRAALRPQLRRGIARTTWDLHTRSAVYGLPLLLVLTVTGILLSLPDWLNPLIDRISPLQDTPRPQALVPGLQTVTPDAARDRALAELPGARASWVETPNGNTGTYRVRLWAAGEPSQRFPHNYVWIDPSTGAVLATQDVRTRSAGDSLLAWLHPLHNGEAGGVIGRWLAFIGGILPIVLAVTGWMRWRQKRAPRPTRR